MHACGLNDDANMRDNERSKHERTALSSGAFAWTCLKVLKVGLIVRNLLLLQRFLVSKLRSQSLGVLALLLLPPLNLWRRTIDGGGAKWRTTITGAPSAVDTFFIRLRAGSKFDTQIHHRIRAERGRLSRYSTTRMR